MKPPNILTRAASESWHPLEERRWREHLLWVDPRLSIDLRPADAGLTIEVGHGAHATTTCLPWPVAFEQAVLFVEDCAVHDATSRSAYHWFRFWLRDRLDELGLDRDPTTACLAFGELLPRVERGLIDHTIGVVGDEGALAVARYFRSPATDQLNAWTYLFHSDGRLDVSLGWTEVEALLRVGPGWVEASGYEGVVTFRTWETSWEELSELLFSS